MQEIIRTDTVINHTKLTVFVFVSFNNSPHIKPTYLRNQELNGQRGPSGPINAGKGARRNPWRCHHADPVGQNPGFC